MQTLSITTYRLLTRMLTELEKQLVSLKKKGLTYKQIGEELKMPTQTTRRKIQLAAKKLGDEFMFRKNTTLTWRKDGGVSQMGKGE